MRRLLVVSCVVLGACAHPQQGRSTATVAAASSVRADDKEQKIRALYEQGCADGSGDAHFDGTHGMKVDRDRGIGYFEKACGRKYGMGCFNLASCLLP